MISTQDSEDLSSSELPLPRDFEKIEDLMSMPTERLQKNPLVNVIGLVRDYQPPISTKGTGMLINALDHVSTSLSIQQISSVAFTLWTCPHKPSTAWV
jgi:hypothetical protein